MKRVGVQFDLSCQHADYSPSAKLPPNQFKKILEFARFFCGAENLFVLHKFGSPEDKNPFFFLRIRSSFSQDLLTFFSNTPLPEKNYVNIYAGTFVNQYWTIK